MKRIVLPSFLLFAPFALMAQVSEKLPSAAGTVKPVQPVIAPNSFPLSGSAISVLPKNFPAINKGTIFNGTQSPEPLKIPDMSGTIYTMPVMVPDMRSTAPMPVVSGIQNNQLPEPMPGAFIYRKKKK